MNRYDVRSVVERDSEGPIALGNNGDIIWYARGRVVVGVPQNSTGGRPEAVARLRERYALLGQPLALAILVKYEHDRPDEETRDDIRSIFDEMSPMLVCNAITVLGSSFVMSFFISFVSQILALANRDGVRYRIHTNLESTAEWMHEELNDPGVSVEDILETLREADREVHGTGAASR